MAANLEAGDMRKSFRDTMSRVAFSVSVVTTDGPAGRDGMTVTAMSSVTLDGPDCVLLISMQTGRHATAAVLDNAVFCVNVLHDGQEAVADAFAGRGNPDREARFATAAWSALRTGAPVLDDGVASFDCRVRQVVPMGDHQVIFGVVTATRASEGLEPLVHWHRSYRRLA